MLTCYADIKDTIQLSVWNIISSFNSSPGSWIGHESVPVCPWPKYLERKEADPDEIGYPSSGRQSWISPIISKDSCKRCFQLSRSQTERDWFMLHVTDIYVETTKLSSCGHADCGCLSCSNERSVLLCPLRRRRVIGIAHHRASFIAFICISFQVMVEAGLGRYWSI